MKYYVDVKNSPTGANARQTLLTFYDKLTVSPDFDDVAESEFAEISDRTQHNNTLLTTPPPPRHKPGVKASPKDNIEEFKAKTLPPGSTPPDQTFRPNTQAEVPSQADNDTALRSDKEPTYTPAGDTFPVPLRQT
jgi:hypothetical protein